MDTHGPDAILAAVARLVPEDAAQVTVSTARPRGGEWASVRIGNDFEPPSADEAKPGNTQSTTPTINESEARLAYVAVTRTRQRLDLGGLSWVSDQAGKNNRQQD
ncbi:hypothetical protein [Streptomyces sp. NBC_01314]|uniref:hypothetical protein n=1 Tax=Streptomyces sp. NBC_01314 TaxID=2903821 RepID=UPI00352D8156